MRKDDHYEEDWVADAQVSVSQAAESEFTRYKIELKRKAGLLPLPLHTRVKNAVVRLLERIKGILCR